MIDDGTESLSSSTKSKNKITPAYLNSYLYNHNNANPAYCTRSSQNETLRTFSSRTESFKHSFFPYCIKEWNKLDNIIRKAESLGKFKSLLLSFIRVKSRSVFSIHDPIGIKLLTRLRLGFSHLNEHKFRHNFRDTVSAMCDSGSEIESTQHFLLRCPIFNDERKKLFKSLYDIKPSILKLQKNFVANILLFVSDKFEETIKKKILQSTITYLKLSSRFKDPLINQ